MTSNIYTIQHLKPQVVEVVAAGRSEAITQLA